MMERKLFGIGAVVLMILVSMSPVLNGSQLEKSAISDSSGQNNTGLTDFYGIITRCEFIEYSQTEDRVLYEIDWVIGYRNGPPIPHLVIDGTLYGKDDHHVYATVTADIRYPSSSDGGTVSLWLTSSENPSVDQEESLAGKMIVLEINKNDYFPENNINESFVKYWRDENNYIPTDPQVQAGAPRWGNKIYHPELQDLFYVDILGGYGGRILSNLLLSKRMGWVGQGLKYLAEISSDLAAIFAETVVFLSSISGDITILGEWFLDIIFWIENLINGIWVPGKLKEIFDNFKNFVTPAIGDIVEKGIAWGGATAILVMKLWDDGNETYNWTLDDPWKKDITIHVRVDNVLPGETVEIECRTKTDVKTRGTDDPQKYLEFIFDVPSNTQGYELFQEGVHNCMLTVSGNMHKGQAKSRPLLSYAFANGSLYWEFPRPGDKSKSVEKYYFIDKLKNLLKERPILTFLEKILEKNKALIEKKQVASTLNRDFDLDALVQKTLNEEKQYEPYDVEYKEYYPGAPRDPHIVYYSSDQVLVGFKSYVDITQIDEVEGYPVIEKIPELNTVIVEIYGIDPNDFIEIVNQSEDVEYAELNYVYQTCYTPNDPLWNEQWGPKKINCPQAWDTQKGDSFVRIAIIDTGVTYNHEDANTWYVCGYDFVNNDDDAMDDCYISHGTHCAGIASAQINNDKGIAGIADVTIVPIKVLDDQGAGYASNIARGIVHAVSSGAKIISMSLGGYGISVLLHTACNYAYTIKNTLIVAAAGNDGLPILCYPARFSSVISVGAVDENLEMCSWSNHGPNLDLVAPGENILSTIGNNQYTELSGTSMATPHVAGVAALFFSSNLYSSANVCRGKLFSTATKVNADCKYGLVNAYGVVKNKNANFQLYTILPKLQQILSNLHLNKLIFKDLI